MKLERLCIKLAQSETEEQVIELLDKAGFWNNQEAWKCYGNNENNFATIGNQQSKPESALVEKIINSVDALLMSECLSRKINPESKKAPQSIRDALINFFSIYNGKLSNIQPINRGKLAENICLAATGTKTNPCYIIIDKGEGQTPKIMPDTLLSIGKSNKLRIPFVQGKFNMGGTGVFQFCGKFNLQLIISKRNPNIAKYENDETKSKWGFTITRREDPTGGVRSSIYKYLAPEGNILAFESEELPILPSEYPIPYKNNLEWGTYIKLYEYQMSGLKTNILFDLYNRLSVLMPNIALPVRLYERRKGYTGHTFETTLSGLSVRLDEDRRENLEKGFPTSFSFSAMGQKMKASIYAFKKEQSKKYTKDEGVIFTINGQTHGYFSKTFFSRQSVGMGYLADSLLIILDCTEFDGRSREDLFLNSRDRIRSGDLRIEIEHGLEDLLRNHPGLRELRESRRREEIEDKLKDSKPLADVIENILKKSPTLSKLFVDGLRLPNPFKLMKAKKKDDYKGKEFPTFFKLKDKYPKSNPKICPINSKFRVQYQTDANNDYFDRDKDPGSFILEINGSKSEEVQNRTLNLWNGIANLTIKPPESIKIGDILHFKSTVKDISRVDSFEDEFYIKIEKEIEKNKNGNTGKRKPPSSEDEGKDVDKTSYLDLPNVIEVRKEDWEKRSFNEESALKVVGAGEEGYDFYVNVDNIHLLTEIKANSSIDERLLRARYKYGMVLIGIALLKDYNSRKQDYLDDEDKEENIYSKIEYVTKIISPILLPMIDSLGELELKEVSEVYEEN